MGQIKEVSACFGLDHLAMTDDGAVFDAVVAIVSALDIALLVNMLGVDAETEKKLRSAHEALKICLDKNPAPSEAISDFQRFLAKEGDSVAFMGEIFSRVVDGKPYETPQSFRDRGSGAPQHTTSPSPRSPAAKAPSTPKPPPGDAIDQLFADIRNGDAPKKASAPPPDGEDEIARLFKQSGPPLPPSKESHGGDEPDEISKLFKKGRP